jgi:hypothetical protein
MDSVASEKRDEAFDLIDRGLDQLLKGGLEPANGREAAALIRRTERLGARLDAASVELLAAIEDTGTYAPDGHFSAKVMVRHVGKLSNHEAAARAATAKALRSLPHLADAHQTGEVGTCQVRRIARTYANQRVRDQLIEADEPFTTLAALESYDEFHKHISQWETLADEDGTADSSKACHRNRKFQLSQDLDLGWSTKGRCGSLDGAQFKEIHDKFIEAELMRDFAFAREQRGPEVKITKDMLSRTDAQRSWDALTAMAQQAMATKPGGKQPGFVTNIVIDELTWTRELDRHLGRDVAARDPFDSSSRCETIDGKQIDRREAFAVSVADNFRRAVVDSAGVTIDLSRRDRFFVRNARLAVQLASTHCMWPGCLVPTASCQVDHIEGWAEQADGTGGGETNPHNGEPFCGYHNRVKETGYVVSRDDEGRLHIFGRDGTEID